MLKTNQQTLARVLLALAWTLSIPSCIRHKSGAAGPPTPRPTSPSPDGPKANSQVSTAAGGVIDGNGGEFIGIEHNPWFIGKSSVSYCVDVGSDFSLAPAEASKQIAAAFAAWKKTLTTIGSTNSPEQFRNRSGSDYEMFGGLGSITLALDVTEVACAAQPPLVFKLGVRDPSVDAALRYSAEATVGLALRTSYDHKTGLSQGFVWVAPDRGSKAYSGPTIEAAFWSHPHVFRNVIMHEIGHTFGIQHLSGTIMDAKTPGLVVAQGLDVDSEAEELAHASWFYDPFCGEVAFSDSEALALFSITSSTGLTLCVSAHEDLPHVGYETTPVLLEFKQKGATLASQQINLDTVGESHFRIAGNYLQRDKGSTPYLYKQTIIYSIPTQQTGDGVYTKADGSYQPVQIHMPVPGVTSIKLPILGYWRSISAVAYPGQEALRKLYELLEDKTRSDTQAL